MKLHEEIAQLRAENEELKERMGLTLQLLQSAEKRLRAELVRP